jgi:hypothetical protein
VLPLWTAAVDPRVLAVRAVLPCRGDPDVVDLGPCVARLMRGPSFEHAACRLGSTLFRLDIIEGTLIAGPVALHFDVKADARLKAQLATIASFRLGVRRRRRSRNLVGKLLALQALDAKATGASLRDIADLVLGAGDWPGDGDHRKSLVRRLLDSGARMVRAGPRAILAIDAGL